MVIRCFSFDVAVKPVAVNKHCPVDAEKASGQQQ